MEHNIGIWFIIISMLCLGTAIVIAFVYIFNFIIALLNKVKSKLQLQVSHPDKSSSYRILGIHSVCSP
ncbi:hypothetical protein CW664_10015 [Macrococcoides caseolyticum]|uniref:hypothetical protein n=1 Tax=Macrococcoides caseolyticum TaxID=69966 RepID=UPI000C34771C|nr:hypothetical protein [Macrococcus caseolyticus]PKE62577.1 hypothetical protein CW683_09810 [Macrococcus caseolyticus]PKF44564.1 hypothetical protein CW664_10015 [Macrococcus caseolyticus]